MLLMILCAISDVELIRRHCIIFEKKDEIVVQF